MEHLCTTCGKTFSLPKDLQRHKESIHGTIMLSCSKCYKTFNRKDKYAEHSRKCTITCKYCDRRFETKSDLPPPPIGGQSQDQVYRETEQQFHVYRDREAEVS